MPVCAGRGRRFQQSQLWVVLFPGRGNWESRLLNGGFVFPASRQLFPFAAARCPRLLLLTGLLALSAPVFTLEIHNLNILKGPTRAIRNIYPKDLKAGVSCVCF